MKNLIYLPLLVFSMGTLSGSIEQDFGQTTDVDPSSPIYIVKGEPDWSAIWYTSREDLTDSTMVIYEYGQGNTGELHWVLKPTDAKPYTAARAILFRRAATFRFTPPANAQYLTIRFKDSVWRPAVVYMDGNRIGTVGGSNDHKWKTQQLHIQGGIRSPIRIGDNYSDGLSGQFTVDRMRISSEPSYLFPPDVAGYWPVPAENRHVNIGRTNDYGRGPEFLFGMYTGQMYMQDASAGKCGSGASDSFQIWADAGFNTMIFHGYSQRWESHWRQWENEATWAAPAIYTEMGLEEMLFQSECHGIRMIPNYLTDTRAYWIKKEGGNEKVLDRITGYASQYAGHPALFGHNPVDEWDHEDVSYTKPHDVSQQYYAAFKNADPSKPVFMSLMGFGENTAWKTAAPSTDILANDKYCDETHDSQGMVKLGYGCRKSYEYMRDMYEEVGDTKARVTIPHFGESDKVYNYGGVERMANQHEQVFQSYTGIVAGTQGLIYFVFQHPQKPIPGIDSAWAGIHQMRDELFGAEGIAQYLIAPAATVENAANCSHGVKTLVRTHPDGTMLLIAVNFEEDPVAVSCTVQGLDNGLHLARFGGGSITASGGSFTDTLEGLGRKVYNLSGDYQPPVPPPLPTNPPMQIQGVNVTAK